ncbi:MULTISPECIES: DUF2884 family protein [unclassified Microbulbifer]|uniref:DUF2884 family protein n=1 Tax=unclassified Microbulbifer TaxID=2619833 RepID=UPI0027E3FAAC|nr:MULTISPECIES: DUF2884 family protein [unclassified Microbulbifer]
MWKPLAISGLIALSASAQAGGMNLIVGDDEQCNAELNYAVRIGPDFFETRANSDNSELLVHYQSPAQLIVAGETVDLDDHQQELLKDYRNQLHNSGREILLLSLEAVDVALNGLSVAVTALAGADHPDNIELQQTSDEILRRVEERLNHEGEVYLLGDPDIDEFVEQAITDEFEPRIEKLARESAGTIAWHALKAAFTGGRSIEYGAERAAEEIEQKVEKRAELLEKRAGNLCEQLKSIDQLERKLHQSIPALAPYDIVKVN